VKAEEEGNCPLDSQYILCFLVSHLGCSITNLQHLRPSYGAAKILNYQEESRGGGGRKYDIAEWIKSVREREDFIQNCEDKKVIKHVRRQTRKL
jgi:hypothetical protein